MGVEESRLWSSALVLLGALESLWLFLQLVVEGVGTVYMPVILDC